MDKPNIFKITLIILSVIAAFVFLSSAYQDIGVAWDSVHYLASADNFFRGKGFMTPLLYWQEPGKIKPLTHYPPLYSFFISCLIYLGLTPFNAAYLLIFILLILNLFLSCLLIYKILQSKVASLITFAILITSREFIGFHYALLSDSLFILFLLLFCHLFLEFIRNNRFSYLLGMSFCLAFACLTRYVGVSLVASGFLSIWMVSRNTLKKKIREASIFLLVSIIPLFIWYYRGLILSVNPIDRVFVMNNVLVIFERILGGIATTLLWFFPNEIFFYLKLFVSFFITLALVIICFFIIKNRIILNNAVDKTICKHISLFFVVFILIFLVLLMVLLSFFEPELLFQDRILAPMYIIGLFMFIVYFAAIFRNMFFKNLILKCCVVFLATCFFSKCLFNVFKFSTDMPHFLENGFCIPQLNDARWNNSALLNFLCQQKDKISIFSNAQALIYFTTGKPAYDVLRRENKGEINNFISKVKVSKGIIVYVNIAGKNNYVDRELLLTARKNHILFTDHTGIAFTYD